MVKNDEACWIRFNVHRVQISVARMARVVQQLLLDVPQRGNIKAAAVQTSA